jgi:hypothetical protein
MGDLTTSLRALAHPGSVLALVLLVLNDHVLKQAWPGWVTGKLSDVAGLVVAPLLLAAVLTLVRTPRAVTVALGATGAGFVLCKTSAAGAAVTSSVWSLMGTPTMMRADVTDLLALPALYAAWRIHLAASTAVGPGWRRTVAVAVGTALLPLGVLATSATSCSESEGITTVGVVEGEFTGPPRGAETRLVGGSHSADFSLDGQGTFRSADFELADGGLSTSRSACVGSTCWRLQGDDTVEVSSDGGRTYAPEAELTEDDRERIDEEEGTDDGCDDDPPRVGATDIAAMESEGTVRAIVALQRGGIWLRQQDGSWEVLTESDVYQARVEDEPPPPVVTEVDGPTRPPLPVWSEPTPAPTQEPRPGCASPTQRTVTPNPLNGPPTTYEVCP